MTIEEIEKMLSDNIYLHKGEILGIKKAAYSISLELAIEKEEEAEIPYPYKWLCACKNYNYE